MDHCQAVEGQLSPAISGTEDEAERAALRELAGSGACVIADALHTDHSTAQHLLDLGLDFLLTVNDSQHTVLEQVCASFHWDCLRPYTTVDCDHGRIETRSIRVSDELAPDVPCVSFPGVRFVAQVRREVEYKKDGRQRQPETDYLLTSLPPEVATPQLLRLLRTTNIKRRMLQLHLNPNGAVALLLGRSPWQSPRPVGQGPAVPAPARLLPLRLRTYLCACCCAPADPANSPHRRASIRLSHLAYAPSRSQTQTLNLPDEAMT